MAISDHHLAEDEELIYETRQHWTTMVGEFLQLCLTVAAAALLIRALPDDEAWGGTAVWVVLGAALVVAVWRWLVPLLQWRATVYFLTTKRLHKRSGFLTKTGTSIPLSRVNDVTFTATLWQRIMGYGTLRVQSASEHGLLTLRAVPEPEALKNRIYQAVDELESDEHGH
ncbi:PH domain-containing protein [Streptomyces sp. NBC_01803]|uniref:PH domain-containing protein n=1 Tax=Streptomyces sp. NBC_01803 TaxID=2975946 RepID=UPI002DDB8715|nr:PH domain-containing protein [Streptomyces sp. NBC_01803]WSA45048.1 PH domain-containing protein [Streptomyces sp. NBC_01803]